ncbi:MAG: Asp-tRNA(Asn)/Glu-tRNA(Gln) amidotransferase subunit GatA [Candidatus Taylorbacteria bacterium]|nr:Asp-tRNA(Asn)/Glu-tRNA(Gln) amidotransferase subunit GatA [Candidatus Taylorbacteria bacterium]
MTIKKARQAMDDGVLTAVELASACLEEIKKKDGEIHAFLEVFKDVMEQAKAADLKIKKGEKAPLLGIPLAVKDNILIEGRRAGSASKILEGYIAPYDSTVADKLKKAGAVLIGRTNMDEFAMGSSTENSAYGPTKNPVDTTRVPGGSSGGSAAAVAAHFVSAALGSDTGGSIRQPAAFCGVVGYKPSYGSVSRHGLMAMGSSLDVIGPITKTMEDAEILYSVIKGEDRMDSTTVEVDLAKKVPAKPKVADLTDFIEKIGKGGMDLSVLQNYSASLNKLAGLGYEIKKLKTDLTPLTYSLPIYYVIMPAEASANLSRFDGVRFGYYADGRGNLLSDYKSSRGSGFGKEPRRRILLGTYVLSSGYYDAYYGRAVAIQNLIKKTFHTIFEEVDIVATPTTSTPAFKFGAKTADPVEMYLADVFTVIANMAGIPGVSLPSGFAEVDGKQLPIGFQLMANYGEDALLFKAGKDFLGEK